MPICSVAHRYLGLERARESLAPPHRLDRLCPRRSWRAFREVRTALFPAFNYAFAGRSRERFGIARRSAVLLVGMLTFTVLPAVSLSPLSRFRLHRCWPRRPLADLGYVFTLDIPLYARPRGRTGGG